MIALLKLIPKQLALPLIIAALMVVGTNLFTLKVWWDERQDRIEAQADLDLARRQAKSSAETAARLREQKQRSDTQLAADKAVLGEIQDTTGCYRDTPMPDAAIRLLHEASSRAAARSSDSAR